MQNDNIMQGAMVQNDNIMQGAMVQNDNIRELWCRMTTSGSYGAESTKAALQKDTFEVDFALLTAVMVQGAMVHLPLEQNKKK